MGDPGPKASVNASEPSVLESKALTKPERQPRAWIEEALWQETILVYNEQGRKYVDNPERSEKLVSANRIVRSRLRLSLDNNLCGWCSRHNFNDGNAHEPYIYVNWSHFEAVSSRHASDIALYTHVPRSFSRLLWQSCSLCACVGRLMSYNQSCQLDEYEVKLGNSEEEEFISLQCYRTFAPMTRTSYIIYPVLSAAAWPPSCWTTARNTPSRTVDFKRIALWMGGCDKHKHWKSKQPGPVEMIPRFRLIDVMNMRLVCAPHIARYAALSYVWGKCKQFLLTQDRVEELETPHSLNKHAHELSKVITDALHSCRCLGIPYLWVDSLCIVQDDANAKHAQIARMDIIYSGAYVTFAAAGGNDADAGLQRVSAPMQTEQQQRILIDKQEYMVARSATCLVDKSPWRRRAWTFQELVLSRRIIFFTEQETILMCESEMLLESKLYARSEKASSLFETGRMMRYLSTPYDFVDANLTVIGAMVKDYKTSWLQLLNEYLGRDLSYDDDIEFAYTGILSAKEAHMGSYHHGLPVQILARALCWFSAHLKTRRPGFPSWSWSGWKFAQSATGPISNQIPPLDPLSSETYSLVVYVRLYGFDGMGHLKLLLGDRDEESGVEGFWGFDQHYPSAPTTEGNNGRNWALFDQFIPPQETPHVSLPEPCPVPRSQLLVFWASCAKFKVSFDEIPMTFDDGPFSTYKVDIDDVGSTRVFVDPGWRAQQPEKLECVAIVGDEISVHAILIQWKNGVAYRVGTVSPILKQEWLTREPERKLVVLG